MNHTSQTPHSIPGEAFYNPFRRFTPAKKRDLVLAALLLIPILLLTNCLCFSDGYGAGVGVSCMIITVITLWYLSKKNRLGAFSLLCAVLVLGLCLCPLLSDDPLAKFLALLAAAVMYGTMVLEASGSWLFGAGSVYVAADLCELVFVTGLSKINEGASALFKKEDEQGQTANRKIGKVIAGVALSLPVFIVLIPLLMSSDAAFEGLMNLFSLRTLFELFITLAFGSVLFLTAFTMLFRSYSKEARMAPARPQGMADTVILASFLGAISAVYLLYLLSQTAYFFNAFSGLIPQDFTLSDYARRGFFEMCALSAINLIGIFVTTLIVKRREGDIPGVIKGFIGFFSLFSLVIIGTALSKMFLYIRETGLTRLRIYTSIFMFFLAIVFVCVIVKLFVRRFPYMKFVLVCACVLAFSMCAADTDKTVANYNVNAYFSGQHKVLDLATISRLNSSSTVEALLRVAEEGDEYQQKEAREILGRIVRQYFYIDFDEHTIEIRYRDVRSFNFADYHCRQLLIEHWEEFDYDYF